MMKSIKLLFSLGFITLLTACNNAPFLPENLVPITPSTAPDYFCTWNMQVYLTSDGDNKDVRKALNEKNVFGDSNHKGWVDLFPKIREDLLFVLDDSWDIPADQNAANNKFLGSTVLDTTRFPSFNGTPAERLEKLVDSIESKGWKGVGGWICAQEPVCLGKIDTIAFWSDRLKESNIAGMDYWKVDWGIHSNDAKWRRQLTDLGRKFAPNLCIEHAINYSCISFSDVFRTYDVEAVIAQPQTLNRISKLVTHEKEPAAMGLINCEDEPYIAAGMGCAFGVMRHAPAGNFPNGNPDDVFPAVGRDLKNRLTEVVRGAHWHRLALPFGVGVNKAQISKTLLTDYWILRPHETWNMWSRKVGDTLRVSAPDIMSRGLALATFDSKKVEDRPFVLSSLYPNGAVAITTVGRGLGHKYVSVPVALSITIPNFDHPIGIFGVYKQLSITSEKPLKKNKLTILAQDLASDRAINITGLVKIKGNALVIPGKIIQRIGTECNVANDKSDPGLVLQVFENDKSE